MYKQVIIEMPKGKINMYLWDELGDKECSIRFPKKRKPYYMLNGQKYRLSLDEYIQAKMLKKLFGKDVEDERIK